MLLFRKKNITPIMVPDIYFTDLNQKLNRYAEMNPSMYVDDSGNVTILVRCVNYRKVSSRQFTVCESVSNSKYYIVRGKINNDIEQYEYKQVIVDYNLPTYTSYWKGVEDIRFIDDKNILAIVPELNVGGTPSIFKASIAGDKISHFEVCYPNVIEKNWMPYDDKVIYSVFPFMIKSIERDDLEEIPVCDDMKIKLSGYHGSTNGIEMNEDRLFLIHKNTEVVVHRWLIYNIKSRSIRVSEEFTFFKHSRIEFACSLCKYKEQIFVSLGVNDEKAYIIETSLEDIMNTFHNEPTIVSMLYNIRVLENKQIERNRKADSYMDFAKQFLLQLPYPMILFTDRQDVYDTIYEYRKDLGLLDKTRIILCEFKDTYFYKDLNRITELQTKFCILNGEIEHETPMYVIVNNNKFDCIDKATQLNPYNSTHFMWVDFGINHVAKDTDVIHSWIYKIPDKIKQLCINPYLERDEPKTTFQYIYHHTAGSLFSGSIANMREYARLFKAKTAQIYSEDWYQIDEAVMTMVQRENPDLFEFYYGDYQGLISNYISPIHNLDLISRGIQKYIKYNYTREAYTALCYCAPYYNQNPTSGLVYDYIQQHMIVDYYHNNKRFTDSVIDLIVLLKDNQKLKDLLQYNENNINFYENKHLIKLNEYKNIIIN